MKISGLIISIWFILTLTTVWRLSITQSAGCNRNNHVLSSFSHWSKSLDQILSDPPLWAVSFCFALYHFVPPRNGRWFPTSARVLHSLFLIKPSRASIFQALIKERPSVTFFCMTFIKSRFCNSPQSSTTGESENW